MPKDGLTQNPPALGDQQVERRKNTLLRKLEVKSEGVGRAVLPRNPVRVLLCLV